MVYERFTMFVHLLKALQGPGYSPIKEPIKRGRKCVAGLYLEEFTEGQVIRHALRKSVTESDNMLFSVMTLNPQPLHIDFDFAARSEWGKPLVNSLFTLGLMIGISVHDTTLGTTIGNLGMTETVFPHPLFHGDTVRVETEVRSIRESRSKADRGIVEFEHRAYNQDNILVARCVRQAMMLKKPV